MFRSLEQVERHLTSIGLRLIRCASSLEDHGFATEKSFFGAFFYFGEGVHISFSWFGFYTPFLNLHLSNTIAVVPSHNHQQNNRKSQTVPFPPNQRDP